jgi:uncharacterized membrane protein YccC
MGFRKTLIGFFFLIIPISSTVLFWVLSDQVNYKYVFVTLICLVFGALYLTSKYKQAFIVGRVLILLFAVNSVGQLLSDIEEGENVFFSGSLVTLNILLVALIYYFFVEFNIKRAKLSHSDD